MTTISGFSKSDLYKKLDFFVLNNNDKHINKKEFETAICISVELICTHKEFVKFIRYYVNIYSNFIVDYDYNNVMYFYYMCNFLKNNRNIKKIAVQKTISNFITFLFFSRKYTPLQYYSKKHLENLNSLMSNEQIFEQYSKYLRSFQSNITRYMYQICCVLLHCVKNGLFETIHDIFYEIFYDNRVKHLTQMLPMDWSVLTYFDDNHKKDIYWLMWRIILKFKNKKCTCKLKSELIDTYFKLALFEFHSRKERSSRINLLKQSYDIMSTKCNITFTQRENNDIKIKVEQKIHEIFSNLIGDDDAFDCKLDYLHYIPIK